MNRTFDVGGVIYGIVLGLVLSLVVFVALGYAEDGYCGDANGVTGYIRSIDRSVILSRGCFPLSKGQTVDNTVLITGNPVRHLKVVAGVLTLKTQAERDAADVALAAQQAAEAAAVAARTESATEVTNNNLCTATLAEITSRVDTHKAAIQADIDAATTLATARTAMTTMNNRFAAAIIQIARCINARARIQ